MGVINGILTVEFKFLFQFLYHRIGQDREQLIGGRVGIEGISQLFNAFSENGGHLVFMGSHLKEQAVAEQLLKLDSGYKALGQHGATVFYHVTEVFLHKRICNDQRFPYQGAVFRSSNVKGVRHGSNIGNFQVVFFTGHGRTQAGTVQVKV